MIYLSDEHITRIGVSWHKVIESLTEAINILQVKDYAQPIKPYLRYKDPVNRIIAMPAFLGGEVNTSGIKWIASFPGNIDKGLQRAHSVTILNEADTGIPFCIVNTTRVSAIRTAGVTGVLIKAFLDQRNYESGSLKIGIIGFGPIGKMHLSMVGEICGDCIKEIMIYDIRPVDKEALPSAIRDKVNFAGSWEEAYNDADIFITCTVSSDRYINMPPKPGSLQMNVSLRDYQPQLLPYMNKVIVDDWDEICRQNTDIEIMHKEQGLKQEDAFSLSRNSLTDIVAQTAPTDTVMFNPMGMAIFDIATAWLYYQESKVNNIHVAL
jgi:N-[(2S)-2-amino-2-carboxyethyl]-L-glutamate dehydrogenase